MFEIIYTDPLRWFMRISIGGAIALLVPPLQAQPAALQEAKEAYEVYEYERATDLFSEVAYDSEVEREVRREALQYLGRIYIGRDRREKARKVIESMVSLEPPPVELNPNRQPPPLMRLYYEVRKQQCGGYEVCGEGPGLQTLAIMDFRNRSVDQRERYAPLSKGFPSMMINYLNGVTNLKVIERERIQWVLDELKLQRKADIVDQSTAVETGKVMGATAVLFGTYIIQEDEMLLSARLVNVETSEIILSEKVKGESEEFFELVKKLSQSAARSINAETEETEIGEIGGTSLMDAQLSYLDGLNAQERGNYQKARKHFEQALEYDPNYTQAQNRLESLKPMLASTQRDTTRTSGGEGGSLHNPNP